MPSLLRQPLQSSEPRMSVARAVQRYPSVFVTVGVGVVSLVLLLLGQPNAAQFVGSVWALLVAGRVAVGMVRDMLAGHWGVDLLAVTAITATVLVGEYLASLVVVLMLTGGQALEDFAAHRARRDLRALMDRAPNLAHLVDADGSVTDIPAEEVRAGYELLVRPSEVVPVDGTLISADAELDESSLTGESLPVTHHAGDLILSGSLNTQEAVTLRATATAEDSQYSRIVSMVESAAESKAPVVRLADRYAVPFTALAFLIAGFGWWYHQDPVVFAEVLVVATPCPLLIAAPVAFLGGMSRAARTGVIIKNAGTLEQLAGSAPPRSTRPAPSPTAVPSCSSSTRGSRGRKTSSCACPPRPNSTRPTCWRTPSSRKPGRGASSWRPPTQRARRRPPESPPSWTTSASW